MVLNLLFFVDDRFLFIANYEMIRTEIVSVVFRKLFML